jgi:HlyD family secretion protein
MSKKTKILIGSGVGLLIVVLIAVNLMKKKDDTVEVTTEKVKQGSVIKTVTASGKIQPVTDVKISSNVSARIIQLYVKEGDRVKKGQRLVALDRTLYEAAGNQARAEVLRVKAQVMSAEANYKKAKQDYDRIKDLHGKNLSSDSELETAATSMASSKSSLDAAVSAVQAAEAQLAQSLDNLSKTEIYSPIDGTVSTLNKENGEIALGSQFSQDVIMVIANLSSMEARVNVDENDVVHISLNDSAKIEVDAFPDRPLRGTVTEIANSANITAAGTQEEKTEFEVKIALDESMTELRPGMSTTSDVTTDVRTNVLSVPIQCVTVREPDKLKKKVDIEDNTAIADDSSTDEFKPNKDGVVEIVFVVENGTAVARAVKTGIQSETHIEIISGLNEGDEVITGNYRAISKVLENGSKVRVNNEMAKKDKGQSTEEM